MARITAAKLARMNVSNRILIRKDGTKYRSRSVESYEPAAKRTAVTSPNTDKTHYCSPGQIIWFGKGKKRK